MRSSILNYPMDTILYGLVAVGGIVFEIYVIVLKIYLILNPGNQHGHF